MAFFTGANSFVRCTRDPSLRLKNGSGRDDTNGREISRAPDECVRGYVTTNGDS